ncbi:MAG: 4Fe-4S binding protein [Candidatus Rifleibacteriota bacterium]
MLTAFLALFTRFDTFGENYFTEFICKFQFIPAILASPVFWVACIAVILLTLLTGRVYCSAICPFGLLQDAIARISRFRARVSWSFHKGNFFIHIIVGLGAIGAALGGYMSIIALIEPYAIAGRLSANLLQPLVATVFKLTSYLGSGVNWFNKAKLNPVEPQNLVIGLLLLSALYFLTRYKGRFFCNFICPTGAVLRLISSFSIFKLSIDKEKCVGCGLCENSCKASCIDTKNKNLDFTRCVVCFNCVDQCKFSAVSMIFAPAARNQHMLQSRRSLLIGAASLTTAYAIPAFALEKSEPELVILPPGAKSRDAFTHSCISCHLCLTACPSSVIVTRNGSFTHGSLLQPELNFDRGMCEQTCNLCTKICPTGALQPVSLEEKKTLKIAEVKYFKHLCVVKTDGKDCGACAEHCPTKAVRMTPYKDNLMIPEIRPEICIGCGSCEHICPVRPNKAIIVAPIREQIHVKLPKPEPILNDGPPEDFPF